MSNLEMLKSLSESITKTIKGRPMKSKENAIYFPTGNLMLDLVVGGEEGVLGFKSGTIVNVVGDKSAGKTFVANEIIAASHYKYGNNFRWMYCDCEEGYTFDTKKMYGFQVITEESDKAKTVERAFYNIVKFANSLKKNEFGIYVLDSLDALRDGDSVNRSDERIKAYDEDKKFEKGTYAMGKQKFMSQEFFPSLISELQDKNILLVIISQIRDKIDPMSFEKYNRAGGKAMDFYCHTVVWLAGATKILKKDTPVGGVVKAKTTKSKTPRPYRDCMYSFMFDYGIDDTGSCLDYLYDLRTDTGKLSTGAAKAIPWEVDDTKLVVNAKNVRQWLKDKKLWDDFTDSDFYEGKASLDSELEFIYADDELHGEFNNEFSATMDRDKLIDYIEENGLQDELHKRVIEKWENFESSLKTTRRRKYYADAPENTDETSGLVG